MNARVAALAPPVSGPDEKPPIDLHRYIALFRRRFRLFLSIAIAVFFLTVGIVLQLTPQYTATSVVMLDPRKQNVVDVQQVLSGMPSDTTAVDTEVEVLKSRNLAEKVVAEQHLDQDAEFNGALRPKPFWRAMMPGARHPASPEQDHSRVVDAVLKRLKVGRAGLTYVINVSFTSKSAAKATSLANAFADRYLLEQLDAKFEATRRASDWLNSRLAGLRDQVQSAEAAVESYKAAHGLMGLNDTTGSTITQQEISNINTQLATARAEQAEAEAKLNTARSQLSRGSAGDDLAASLSSPVIGDLRKQRAEVSGLVADLAGRYGPKHPEMLKAQRQLEDIDAQIQAEIRRNSSNLEAQAQVARERTASIERSLAASRGNLAASNGASVRLNELQRNAESVRTLYQSFLDRFKQTSAQQGIEQSDSRVVSRAKIPTQPSFPNLAVSITLGALVALAAAIGSIIVIEALENGIYTSEDVERTLGTAHLGSIPLLSTVLDGGSKKEMKGLRPLEHVVEHPLSSFAEAFRSLRTSIMFSRVGEPVKVIALTSALPGEGKTTTSICLGRVTAMGGASTVVVDCDLRRRSVNQIFETPPAIGLMDVLAGKATLDEVLVNDAKTGLKLLPLGKAGYTPKDLFASAAMDSLLAELRRRFDVVLLDTAPILPVADTRVLAPKADVTIFLTQWKRTPRMAVMNSLKQLESVGAHIGGVCLTQVNMVEQARSGYGDAGYYYRSYNAYYGAYGYGGQSAS